MDFDPMYLGNRTFLDHSSQENFDQQFWFQWYIGCHGLEENILQSKNADVSTHVTVQSVSIKKIVSFDIIMKFWKFHFYHKLKYQCDRFSVGLNFRPLDSSDTSEVKGFLFWKFITILLTKLPSNLTPLSEAILLYSKTIFFFSIWEIVCTIESVILDLPPPLQLKKKNMFSNCGQILFNLIKSEIKWEKSCQSLSFVSYNLRNWAVLRRQLVLMFGFTRFYVLPVCIPHSKLKYQSSE